MGLYDILHYKRLSANNQPVDMIKMKDSLQFNRGTKALIFLCPRLAEALVPLL